MTKMKFDTSNIPGIDQTTHPIPVTFEGRIVGFANNEGEINFVSEDAAILIMGSMNGTNNMIGISSRHLGRIDDRGMITDKTDPQEFAIYKLNNIDIC